MRNKNYYPQIIEEFACRNFNKGNRVRVYHKGIWRLGEVVDKYAKERWRPPCILIKTDEKVDDCLEAYLGGFGIEIYVDSPRVLFEYEKLPGDEIYTKTYLREMTPEEKEDQDNLPF